MQALVVAQSECTTVWRATGGIVFLATPFRSTAFEDVAFLAVNFLKSYATLTGKVVPNLLESVKDSTPFLQELVGDFTTLYRERDQSRLAIFYEMKEGNLVRKVFPQWLADRFKKPRLVSSSNA